MTMPARVTSGGVDPQAERVPLGRQELLLIVAFWTLFALFTAANRMVDPRTGAAAFSAPTMALVFFESYLWALLTPPFFWLTSRLSAERGSRVWHALLLLFIGLAVAAFVDIVVELARVHVFPLPHRRTPPPTMWTIARLRYLDHVVVSFALIAAGLARDYFQRYRARQAEAVLLQAHAAQLQAQLAEARLSVLRTQLNPHFLFNTLHAVSALVERDPKGVRRMIARLSELLRYTLDGTTAQEITVREELDLLQRYLEIMQIRFQGRLEASVDIAPEVQNALVPNLILQPLVENAMKHGVSDVAGLGRIVVTARRADDELVLAVRDNGRPSPITAEGAAVGASAENSDVITSGVGLRNTRARLEQLYGAKQRFTLQPAPGGGMIAEVVLPFHTRAEPLGAGVPVLS